jgi:hypothetical protein
MMIWSDLKEFTLSHLTTWEYLDDRASVVVHTIVCKNIPVFPEGILDSSDNPRCPDCVEWDTSDYNEGTTY